MKTATPKMRSTDFIMPDPRQIIREFFKQPWCRGVTRREWCKRVGMKYGLLHHVSYNESCKIKLGQLERVYEAMHHWAYVYEKNRSETTIMEDLGLDKPRKRGKVAVDVGASAQTD